MSDSGPFNLLAEALAKSKAAAESKTAKESQTRPGPTEGAVASAPADAKRISPQQTDPAKTAPARKPASGNAKSNARKQSEVWPASIGHSKKNKKPAPVAVAGAGDWNGVGIQIKVTADNNNLERDSYEHSYGAGKTKSSSGGKNSGITKSYAGAKVSGVKLSGAKTEADTEAELFALAMSGVDNLGAQSKKRYEREPEDAFSGLFTLADKLPAPPGKNKTRTASLSGISALQKPEEQSGTPSETAGPEDTLTWHDYLTDKAENPELEKRAFSKAMEGVTPIFSKGRELQLKPDKSAAKVQVDHNLVLQELIDGKLEFSLEYSGEFVECQVVGLDTLVLDKLKAGQYSPEAHVDLHGQNAEQAHSSLLHFIRNSYQRNLRNVIVVTGRGLNSPNGISVLRDRIQSWLTREPFKRVVLAFCTARAHDGGPGALYVLLRKYKKSRGKIFWDRIPTPDELDG